jgi:hypothetical protein
MAKKVPPEWASPDQRCRAAIKGGGVTDSFADMLKNFLVAGKPRVLLKMGC